MSALSRRSALLALGAGVGSVLTGCAASPAIRQTAPPKVAATSLTPTPTPTPTFDLAAHSIDDPTSIWVVVNKRRPLGPKTYVPPDLRAVDVPHTNPPILRAASATAVETMFAAAAKQHVHLVSVSTYRPYTDQKSIFESDVANLGVKGAEALTLRPGYSEHQTGWAIDIGQDGLACTLASCFGTTDGGEWAKKHAWKYGFLLRYPKPDEHITGIEYEPWHFRYVGTDLAAHLHEARIATLEQLFGLPDAPDYGS